MKNTRFIKTLILLFSLSVFISCETEAIDPALLNLAQDQNSDCLSPEITSGAFTSASNVSLTWTPANGETAWQIQYGISGFALGAGSLTNATSATANISGLQSTNSYDFWIRTVCSATEFGSWDGPYTITPPNPNCATPTAVTVVRNADNTTATVNWTAGGTETSWEVLYVAAGFPIAQGTTFQASAKPFTLTGLTNDSFDIYVRAKCAGNEFSSWSAKKTLAAVSTGGTGIVGNYLLTGFTSSVPIDINGNGTSSNNVLSETICFNDLKLILLANNSFALDSKGADIVITVVNNVEVESIECYVDPIETGIWALNGSILTLTYSDNTTDSYTYNSANNTLNATVSDGTIVGTTDQGGPVTLTTDLTFTFTKQ